METKNMDYDTIIAKLQQGQIGFVEYILFQSEDWRNEYVAYCIANDLRVTEESAQAFSKTKDDEFQKAIENGLV